MYLYYNALMSISSIGRHETHLTRSAGSGPKEELIGVSNRVLIIGANSAGAYTLKEEFLQFLKKKGIQNPIVQTVGGPESLERAFFTGGVPRGVILLPLFRWHDERGMGNTSSSYETGFNKTVENLCLTNGVHLVQIVKDLSEKDISVEIKQLFGVK